MRGKPSLSAGQSLHFPRVKPSLLRGKAFISPGVTIDSPSTKALFPFSVSICSLRSKHFELTKETLFQINTGRNYRKQKQYLYLQANTEVDKQNHNCPIEMAAFFRSSLPLPRNNAPATYQEYRFDKVKQKINLLNETTILLSLLCNF